MDRDEKRRSEVYGIPQTLGVKLKDKVLFPPYRFMIKMKFLLKSITKNGIPRCCAVAESYLLCLSRQCKSNPIAVFMIQP